MLNLPLFEGSRVLLGACAFLDFAPECVEQQALEVVHIVLAGRACAHGFTLNMAQITHQSCQSGNSFQQRPIDTAKQRPPAAHSKPQSSLELPNAVLKASVDPFLCAQRPAAAQMDRDGSQQEP
jgi:hypothetical protein